MEDLCWLVWSKILCHGGNQTLSEASFEPHDQAGLQAWTWKVPFLVAITLTARVSELQALDSRPELLPCTRGRALLRLNPAFLPKVLTPDHLNRKVVLQAFHPHPKKSQERLF